MGSKLESTLVALHIYERYRIQWSRACQLFTFRIDLCHVTDSRCKILASAVLSIDKTAVNVEVHIIH
jgi:hypothetical protein